MAYWCCNKQHVLFSQQYCCLGIIALLLFIMAHVAGSPAADRWVITAEWLSNNILCDDVHTGDKERVLRTGYLTFILSITWEHVVCERSRGKDPLVCSCQSRCFLSLTQWVWLIKVYFLFFIIIIIILFSKDALHSSKVTVKSFL